LRRVPGTWSKYRNLLSPTSLLMISNTTTLPKCMFSMQG
jgi:hypothetical protein